MLSFTSQQVNLLVLQCNCVFKLALAMGETSEGLKNPELQFNYGKLLDRSLLIYSVDSSPELLANT